MINELTKLWDKYFDKIYCLVYTKTFKDRQPILESELSRVGILQTNKLNYHFTIQGQLKDKIIEEVMPKMFLLQNKQGFDCSYNHYLIISEAQQLGYKRILILEDDVSFLKDIDKIYNILLNFPENANICLFDHIDTKNGFDKDKNIYINEYYYKATTNADQNWTAACYSLDQLGMQFALALNNTGHLNGADAVLAERQDIMDKVGITRIYTPENLAIQSPRYEYGKTNVILHYPLYMQNGLNLENYNW